MKEELGSPEPKIQVPKTTPGFRWPYRVVYADLRTRRIQSTTILIVILIFLGVLVATVIAAAVFLVAIVLDSIV